MNRSLVTLAFLGALALPLATPAAVHRIVLDGPVDPVHAEYVLRGIDAAEREDSRLVVLVLNTPGGLVDAMEEIIRRMLSSRVPVAVYVSPSGGRAASAGFFLLMSADVAAMAPGTRTGAAHPVMSVGGVFPIEPERPGEPGPLLPRMPPPTPAPSPSAPDAATAGDATPGADDATPAPAAPPPPKPAPAPRGPHDSTMMEKITNDAMAYLRSITVQRGRNPDAAALAVSESKSYSDQEALDLKLIDLVAVSEADLLQKLDGREARRLDGTTVKLATRDQPVVTVEMTFREKALAFLTNPSLAFLLFLVGALLLYIEITHTGLVLPGVVGGICLLLAVTGFSMLPVTATGVLLILAAIGLFVAELFVQSFGVLGLAAVVCLALGGIMLVDVPEGGVGVDPYLAIGAAVGFGAIFLFLGNLALRALRRRTTTGSEGLVGETARTVTDLAPHGTVMLRGEYWRAVAPGPVPAGTAVRVTAVNGLTVSVEAAGDTPASEGESHE